MEEEKVVRFSPTKDFHCEENGSGYCAGLSYTARENNAQLLALVETWLQEGLVVVVDPAATTGRARMGGKGLVT